MTKKSNDTVFTLQFRQLCNPHSDMPKPTSSPPVPFQHLTHHRGTDSDPSLVKEPRSNVQPTQLLVLKLQLSEQRHLSNLKINSDIRDHLRKWERILTSASLHCCSSVHVDVVRGLSSSLPGSVYIIGRHSSHSSVTVASTPISTQPSNPHSRQTHSSSPI